ncbi:MAG TPA: sugar phosphate nucleotidyltransferase [Saprospiraceae bacterium]|nr:sugar phosphate nucleotidyltransferase [Saprospiraceae bacterium]
MEKPSLVILAAGMGSRYGGLKQLDSFGPHGETIIDYSLYDAIGAGFSKAVFIIRDHFREEFVKIFSRKYGSRIEVEFVSQELDNLPIPFAVPKEREKPWGTAHAVWVAREVVNGPFAVINGDDYYGKSAFVDLVRFFNDYPGEFGVMAYYLKNTLSDYGTVNRGVCYANETGFLTKVEECVKIERKANGRIAYPINKDQWAYLEDNTLVSMNLWAFTPFYFKATEKYFTQFLNERGTLPKSEFYIPDVIDLMIKNNETNVRVLHTDSQWFGVTYQEDKPFVVNSINELIEKSVYPSKLWD